MNILSIHQWLKPVILATWEAAVRQIMVVGQLKQIVHQTPISKNNNSKKMGWRSGSSGREPALQNLKP
jgi:hypothetical protein